MSAALAGFYLLAVLLVGTALAMVTARNLVHAALFMVANFTATTVLYLALSAPFIAAVQLIVYAGAIMVLFLFVVMLLGARQVDLAEPIAGQRLAGLALVLVLAGLLVFVVREGVPAAPPAGLPAEALPVLPAEDGAAAGSEEAAAATRAGGERAFGSPAMVGEALFSTQVLPFELVSVLLLIAMLGAVLIARFRGGGAAGGAAEAPPEGGAG